MDGGTQFEPMQPKPMSDHAALIAIGKQIEDARKAVRDAWDVYTAAHREVDRLEWERSRLFQELMDK